ncbi:DinB family protein [Bryobacter aggregatus]|uniref:DinB family protein n=1 Tax=Bryobacter aggregatus TaxID=360054 RepID=UPI0006918B79|nr:DinB family protein [Bryobacter aggregatus]
MEPSISDLFRSHSVRKLRDMMALIEKWCAGMSEEQVWHREVPDANSVGNLLMHLEGNLGQFIGHSLEGKPDVRVRPLEFSTREGIEKASLLSALQARIEQTCLLVERIDDEGLRKPVTTLHGQMTGLEVIYQVVGHLQQHTGQIIFAAKIFAGR